MSCRFYQEQQGGSQALQLCLQVVVRLYLSMNSMAETRRRRLQTGQVEKQPHAAILPFCNRRCNEADQHAWPSLLRTSR